MNVVIESVAARAVLLKPFVHEMGSHLIASFVLNNRLFD